MSDFSKKIFGLGMNGNTPLHSLSKSSSPYAKESLKALIDGGMNVDETNDLGETPLMIALDNYLCASTLEEKINIMQNIKLLLEYTKNIDIVDSNAQSALHRVCQTGNIILFNEIFKLNPKINQIDILGNTPFEYIPNEVKEPMYMLANQYLKNNRILKENEE